MKSIYCKLFLFTAMFSCRVLLAGSTSGQIVGWGANSSGQATGISSPTTPIGPGIAPGTATGVVTIAGVELTNVVAISAGDRHCLALRSDGTMVEWGNNNGGLVKVGGNILSNVTAIFCGDWDSLALKKDGTIISWGNTKLPEGLTNIMAISSAGGHCLALRRDGTVAAWGRYARVPRDLSNVVAVVATSPFSGGDIALKRDGTVVQWRLRDPHEGDVVVTNLGDAIADMKLSPVEYQPATNVDREYGVTNFGSIHQEYHQVEGLSNVVAIASGSRFTGASHALALRSDGTVFGWGNNASGEVTGTMSSNESDRGLVKINGKLLTDVVAIAAGHSHVYSGYSLALRSDGMVVEWGASPYHMLDVPTGLSNVVAIAAGDGFCLALTTGTNLPKKNK